jgi:Flp pilus assembly protein TadD/peroxiredoxin
MSSIRINIAICAAVVAGFAVQAQETATDPALLAGQAMQMQQAGDYAGAAEAFRALLKINPNDVASHVNLGVVLVRLGHYDEGIAEYEAALKLLPNDPRIELNLALAYQKSGRLSEAQERLEALHQSAPQEDRITMLLADCHLQSGNNGRVIELLKPLESRNTDDLALAYMLGLAMIRTQNIAEGQALIDRILRNGDTAEARFMLGSRMLEAKDYPAAVRQLAGAIQLKPDLPQLQSIYGRALLNTGDPDGALTAFQAELAGNPNDFEANLGTGQILTVRKKYQEAATPLRRALLLRPHSAEATLALAECLNGTGKFAEARPMAEEAAKLMPGSLESHRALLAAYDGLNLKPEARRESASIKRLEQSAANAEAGPKLHEQAPEFEVTEAGSNKRVSLRELRSKSPVVLVFGSYSCPNFRSSAAALRDLQQRYRAHVAFQLVYIREAHGSTNWQSTRNERESVEVKSAETMTARADQAVSCTRKLHLPFPALVDNLDGTVERAYQAWPSRVFVIAQDGRIEYSSHLTELDFHPDQMEQALSRVSSRERASGK